MPSVIRSTTARPSQSLRNVTYLLLLASVAALIAGADARAVDPPLPTLQTTTSVSKPRATRSPNVSMVSNETNKSFPFYVLVILPKYESNSDKFGLTISKARSVIEIAVDDIVGRETLPKNWINLKYEDSRYWDEPMLAEKWAVNAVIKAQCAGQLDAIIGFADPYSLATVAKISAAFGAGIPIITTTGFNDLLGSKRSFPYLTRMQGSYDQMAAAIYQIVGYQEKASSSLTKSLNYKNLVFMYHDPKRAVNKEQNAKKNEDLEGHSSHCFFALIGIKNYFVDKSSYYRGAWAHQTAHYPFDEELPRTREDIYKWLKKVSFDANGK